MRGVRRRCFSVAAWVCLSCGGAENGTAGEDETTAAEAEDSSSSASTSPSDGSTTTPTPTTTGEDTTTGPGACAAGTVCLGEVPLGWSGPLAVAKAAAADGLPSCAAPYDAPEATLFEGFTDAPPAECDCSCGVTTGLCDTLIQGWADDECFLLEKGTAVGASGCVPYDRESGGMTIYSDFSICLPDEEETIPEIPWDAFVASCAAASEGAACDEGRCVDLPPDGFEAELCIAAEGDVECPEDTAFQSRTVRYAAVTDDRGCSECECGTLPACLLTYDYYDTADCSGAPIGTANTAQCEPVTGVAAIEFDFEGVDCPVSIASTPEGSAAAEEPWTYCCAGT